jgi:hypothetical protein
MLTSCDVIYLPVDIYWLILFYFSPCFGVWIIWLWASSRNGHISMAYICICLLAYSVHMHMSPLDAYTYLHELLIHVFIKDLFIYLLTCIGISRRQMVIHKSLSNINAYISHTNTYISIKHVQTFPITCTYIYISYVQAISITYKYMCLNKYTYILLHMQIHISQHIYTPPFSFPYRYKYMYKQIQIHVQTDTNTCANRYNTCLYVHRIFRHRHIHTHTSTYRVQSIHMRSQMDMQM